MVSYIALLPGQYLDIAREGGQYPDIAGKVAFNYFVPPFDPTFHLYVIVMGDISILHRYHMRIKFRG